MTIFCFDDMSPLAATISPMSDTGDQIELIRDSDGLAVIGEPSKVERFLKSVGLLDVSRKLDLRGMASVAAETLQGVSVAATQSGRWVKLTAESAAKVHEHGFMESKVAGIAHAMIGKPGDVQSWVQVETGARSLLNPATLTGVAGVMAQFARQQEMAELKAYLATISVKVDDVLQAQKDAEVSKVVGAGFDIASATRMYEELGYVDDDTWSTVQGRTQSITDALGWALLRLDALAGKLENTTKVFELAAAARQGESDVAELLAVIARCFELQDALDILRLDRVSSEAADGTRRTLEGDRRDRRERVAAATTRLLLRMEAAGGLAVENVLLHASKAHSVVAAANSTGQAVTEFHAPMQIESHWQPIKPRRWVRAVRERDQWANAVSEAGPKVAVGALAVAGSIVIAFIGRGPDRTDTTA